MPQENELEATAMAHQGKSSVCPMRVTVFKAEGATLVTLVIFDKRVTKTFSEHGHRETAQAYADAWGRHLKQAYSKMQEASIHVLSGFSDSLEAHGVGRDTINRAMMDTIKHV